MKKIMIEILKSINFALCVLGSVFIFFMIPIFSYACIGSIISIHSTNVTPFFYVMYEWVSYIMVVSLFVSYLNFVFRYLLKNEN